ncbi:hypothetical protein Lser_V15G32659 [Lactuca serriola]
MTEEGKTKGIAFPGDHQPSAPPQPHPAYYYGTFQGVANHQPPYPPPPPTYQPSVGFPQPSPPANIHNHIHHPYYPHGYQTVPGIVVASGTPVIIEQAALPCCGFGIGWVLFIVGFVFGAIPWYIGAFILLCVRTDRREKAGLVACTIAAVLAVLALGLGVRRVAY